MNEEIHSAGSSPALSFACLDRQQYVALTTFRKSGEPVTTPVWFALDGDKIYVWTDSQSGKAKRIRNNSRVEVVASTMSGEALGSAVAGVARILPAGADSLAKQTMDRKYGFQKKLFGFFSRLRKAEGAYLEILPAA